MQQFTTKAPINHISSEDVAAFREEIDGDNHSEEHVGFTNAIDMYQSIATKSSIYPGRGTPFGLMYVALGLGEGGEVQNKVKKAFRDDGILEFVGDLQGVENGVQVLFHEITPERKQMILKELGGLAWYMATVCDEMKIHLSEVFFGNLLELSGRTARGTLRGDGDDR